MIRNLQQVASFCSVLRNPHTLNILSEVIHDRKQYSYFSNKYGTTCRYTVSELVRLGAIKKILDIAKVPIGYEITEHDRWIYHSCVNFGKNMERITN